MSAFDRRQRARPITFRPSSAAALLLLLQLAASRHLLSCAAPLAPLPPPQSSLFYGGGKVARPSSGNPTLLRASVLAIANLGAGTQQPGLRYAWLHSRECVTFIRERISCGRRTPRHLRRAAILPPRGRSSRGALTGHVSFPFVEGTDVWTLITLVIISGRSCCSPVTFWSERPGIVNAAVPWRLQLCSCDFINSAFYRRSCPAQFMRAKHTAFPFFLLYVCIPRWKLECIYLYIEM